ncbi:PREDICTED: purple acid phosphatase 17-like [Erythranthe guttata]|nr:PREDICTED: purple acid phosphatase 17-like [Erythranthe guttata]|eukprot:XP_012852591.1 PREDICTED: purple acid phosphatase 17-like [Erythranthe guttata]
MANICRNYNIPLLPLLIACLYLSKAIVTAELVQISQPIAANDGSVNFLVVGDWGRKGAFNQSAVAHAMGEIGGKLKIDFVVSTGDNFYTDGLSGVNDPAFAQSFSRIYTAKSLQIPWYSVLGNHDYHGDSEAQLSPLLKKRDRRWNCHRSFDVRAGFVHIFFLDTTPFVNKYFTNSTDEKFNWKNIPNRDIYLSNVVKDLKTSIKSSNATWKIVVGHHPIRSIAFHGDTTELLHQILPILQANKIPMYINGHDHCLQHISNIGTPVEFLTSGGGSMAWRNQTNYQRYKKNTKFYYDGQGFVSVQLTKSEANVVFYDVHGKTLHSFNLKANTGNAY